MTTTAANRLAADPSSLDGPAPTALELRSGYFLDLLDPRSDAIALDDIAIGLARAARFNGQTAGPVAYSVAQHSCWVADRVKALGGSPAAQLHALLHDAHEAYTGDIARPLKLALNGVMTAIERALDAAIATALDLPPLPADERTLLERADAEALAAEAARLMYSGGADWNLVEITRDLYESVDPPETPEQAYWAWKYHYKRLRTEIGEERGTR